MLRIHFDVLSVIYFHISNFISFRSNMNIPIVFIFTYCWVYISINFNLISISAQWNIYLCYNNIFFLLRSWQIILKFICIPFWCLHSCFLFISSTMVASTTLSITEPTIQTFAKKKISYRCFVCKKYNRWSGQQCWFNGYVN